jgi:hypothetical protein
MSGPSDIDAPSPVVGFDYKTTFTGINWALDQLLTPTSNDDAENRNTHPSNNFIIRHCTQKWIYQPNCCGNDASPSRPPNLNHTFVALKTLDPLSSSIQFRKELVSLQKIRNHHRLDLARTDKISENLEKRNTIPRPQGLGESHNSWPTKFCATPLSIDLKAENQPYKQSSPITCGIEEFLNQDQQYTLDRQLKSHHTDLIALSGTIGTGLFLSPPIGDPLPLLMAFTLKFFNVWILIYCLGELAAIHFPMDIGNLRQNFLQKFSYNMIFLGAVYSIPQIRSVVAGKTFLVDEELEYVFGLSCITFGVGLYYTPNILKAISSKMSGMQSLIQTYMERCTNSLLGHRSTRSRSHAGRAFILSLLLWATPVTAIAPSLSTNTPSPYSSFLLALSIESKKLFSVSPFPPFPFSPFPFLTHFPLTPNQPKQTNKTPPALHHPHPTLPPHLPPTNPPPRPPPHHLLNHPPLHLSRTQQHFNEIPALYQRLSRVNPRLRLRSRCGRSRVSVSVSWGCGFFDDFRPAQCNLASTASFRRRARKESR